LIARQLNLRRLDMSVQAAIRPTILDTDFRSALRRMAAAGRIQACTTPIDVNLELASVMKKFDGGKALLFTAVKGHDMPVLGNFLASREHCETAFGVDYRTIREFVGRALGAPQAPELVTDAPVQQNVITRDIDLGKLLPVLHHTPALWWCAIPRRAFITPPITGWSWRAAIAPPSSWIMGVICVWRLNAPGS
jgi:hypothetical protein